jgi:hypothetical protein
MDYDHECERRDQEERDRRLEEAAQDIEESIFYVGGTYYANAEDAALQRKWQLEAAERQRVRLNFFLPSRSRGVTR